MGLFENCSMGQASYGKSIGKSGEQRRGIAFDRGKLDVGKAVTNKTSIGVHWDLRG